MKYFEEQQKKNFKIDQLRKKIDISKELFQQKYRIQNKLVCIFRILLKNILLILGSRF